MHTNSKLLFAQYGRPHFKSGMRVLEIGPDGFPSSYRSMITEEGLQWDTLDLYDSPKLTYPKSQLYSFAIPDNTYDVVVSGQVIEHVAKIWRWMPELARVTRPSGLVITIGPSSWPYHEAPIDCWRMFPEGMKALCEEAGLSVETCFNGSLELPGFARAFPGRSPDYQPRSVKYCLRFLGIFGFPVEKAFDTITVARKAAAGAIRP